MQILQKTIALRLPYSFNSTMTICFFVTFVIKLESNLHNLVMTSALCSVLQDWAALERTKFANFKSNQKVLGKILVFDLLAKKKFKGLSCNRALMNFKKE